MKIYKTLTIAEFELLFKNHYSELSAFANKFLNDVDAAEEIVQAFFVKYWEKRANYTDIQFKKAYFYTSVKNACLNQLKHIEIREEYKFYNQKEMETQEQGIEDEYDTTDLSEKIRKSIDSLPEARRKIFIMSRYEGLKYREIADHLKISIKTVENQMGSAIKHLKMDLAEYLIVITIIILNYLP